MQEPEHEQTEEVTEEMVKAWKKAHHARTEDLWKLQHRSLPSADSRDWQDAQRFYIPVTWRSLDAHAKE